MKKIKDWLIKKLGGYTKSENMKYKRISVINNNVTISDFCTKVRYPLKLYDSLSLPNGVESEIQRALGKVLWENGLIKTQVEKDYYSNSVVVSARVSVANK